MLHSPLNPRPPNPSKHYASNTNHYILSNDNSHTYTNDLPVAHLALGAQY